MSQYTPEVNRYSASVKNSFAYDTAVHRWPAILTQVIDGLFRQSHELSSTGLASHKVAEARKIIEQVSRLKYELTHDLPLAPLDVTPSNATHFGTRCAPTTEAYDDILRSHQLTWFHSDWLFTECYLYRRLRLLFEKSNEWKDFDPFAISKDDAFRASGQGVYHSAMRLSEIVKIGAHQTSSPATYKTFQDMVYSSLWGNASDLSLLINADDAVLQKVQATTENERTAKIEHVVVNDIDKMWCAVHRMHNGRIDFVLDNAGFELMADMLLADFLLTLRGPVLCANEERSNEIASRIERVRMRIAEATKTASRQTQPHLLVVSKLHPPSDLMAAYVRSKQRHFGENYVQELVEKASVLPRDIHWHFIGGLQSNKAKHLAAVPNLYAVESVDSEKLAASLEKALAKPENERERAYSLLVYVQVNTSGEEGKSGVPSMMSAWESGTPKPPLMALAEDIILTCPHMRFKGLMTIGALANSRSSEHENPDFEALVTSRKYLADALAKDSEFQVKLKNASWWTPSGPVKQVYDDALSESKLALSMGMSADMRAAIEKGSTTVRIGSDCFGTRSTNSEASQVRAVEMDAWSKIPLVKEIVFHTKNMPWFVSVRKWG